MNKFRWQDALAGDIDPSFFNSGSAELSRCLESVAAALAREAERGPDHARMVGDWKHAVLTEYPPSGKLFPGSEEDLAACEQLLPKAGISDSLSQDFAVLSREVRSLFAMTSHGEVARRTSNIDSLCDRLRILAQEVADSVTLPRSPKRPLETDGFKPSELAEQLDVTTECVGGYAKRAGVKTPGRGESNYRYRVEDTTKILDEIIDNARKNDLINRARLFRIAVEKRLQSLRDNAIETRF